MRLPTTVYKHYLSSTGFRNLFWSLLRRSLIALFSDPSCTFSIHDTQLTLPLSHSLPENLNFFRFFDRLPQRISAYVHDTAGYLNCIDVGANIGGTIAFFHLSDTDVFLAIEPNPKFNNYLNINWGLNENVTIVSAVCSSTSDDSTFRIVETRGTASIRQSENGVAMRRRTLDDIVRTHPRAMSANVLKIDTDGYDFDVLAGSQKLITANLPVILFECDSFDNIEYVEECLATLDYLRTCGYRDFLLYDNYGSLMGLYSLSDLSSFKSLLFYQLTSDFYYFDILLMKDKDISAFYRKEVEYFAQAIPNTQLKRTAIIAAELTS